ncbi:hypothetical protein HAX54_041753 [Datura stramonium]|uniref:Uncharacterized protein n=1 Tax=Datura stramonium TaxID=4076 RepID=A0ABS8W0G8_DATST|nr:hypothetical protein [Datura stramonium]
MEWIAKRSNNLNEWRKLCTWASIWAFGSEVNFVIVSNYVLGGGPIFADDRVRSAIGVINSPREEDTDALESEKRRMKTCNVPEDSTTYDIDSVPLAQDLNDPTHEMLG